MKQVLIFALMIFSVAAGGVFLAAQASDVPSLALESKDVVNARAYVVDDSSAPTRKTVKVTIAVDKGWHINANPATIESFIPTSVDVQTDPASALKVSYPKGVKMDTLLGPIDVYEGTVEILATAESKEPIDISKMRVLLQVQACKDNICYPPSQIALPLGNSDAFALNEEIRIEAAKIQETPPGAKTAVGYAALISPVDDRLVSLSSPRAEKVEIHTMSMDGGIMRMRPLPEGAELPAGKAVSLNPQGMHLMFMNISAPFKAGEKIPVTFTFSKAAAQTVEIPVQPLAGAGDHYAP